MYFWLIKSFAVDLIRLFFFLLMLPTNSLKSTALKTKCYLKKKKDLQTFFFDLINKTIENRNLLLKIHHFITRAKVWYVECETIVLNPNQSNELFQRTEYVPSVLIWPPNSPQGLWRN